MPVVTPDRSLDQRRAALALANHIRTTRAAHKREIAAGRALASATLAAPPEWAQTMAVSTLLRAMPRVGPRKVDAILRRNAVSPSKTLQGLSSRQRHALLAEVASIERRRPTRQAAR